MGYVGRVSVHIVVIVVLIAVLGSLPQSEVPAAPTPSPSAEPAVVPPAKPLKPVTVEETPQTPATTVPAKEPAPSPAHTIEPRRGNPEPSGLHKAEQEHHGLTIRGIGLGMTETDTLTIYPGPKVVDRVEEYWGPGYPNGARGRYGATWFEYQGFRASYDIKGVCGAVTGDGLERGGVPILARGDSGSDVERLLGKPHGCYLVNRYPPARRDDPEWEYRLTDGSRLTISFSKGLVQSFEWRAYGFSDSGC